MDRCLGFICILHCGVAIRLHVAFIEARLETLLHDNVEALQRLLSRACNGVKFGAVAERRWVEAAA